MYNVRLKKFEGPLELLLELIEKEKLDINELSMAEVTDEYLEYLHNNQNIRLENLAEFLSVASKLILIKSRSLLPRLKFNQEEEDEIEELTYQLEKYKKFKEVALVLGKNFERKKICYSREGFKGIKPTFYLPQNINSYDLKKYFLSVLVEIPIIEKLEEEVVREVVTLEQRISEVENTLRTKIQASFSDLASEAKDKVDVIISFLALLEMVKQKTVQVEQGALFSEINLKFKN